MLHACHTFSACAACDAQRNKITLFSLTSKAMRMLNNPMIHYISLNNGVVQLLTLFEEGEAIPLFEEGAGKFVLHPRNTKSLEKK